MVTDDREWFARERAEYRAALGGDAQLRQLDREITARSDLHNYSYVWDWLGLPIIQMPTDVVALQEIVWRTKPDLIIETGVARGGSIIFFASLCELIGSGAVLGVDIDIRPHNRAAIANHPLAHRVRMIEGSSVAEGTLAQVREAANSVDSVMVVLDSDHTHEHVLAELRSYGPLVTPGQYMVVADTLIEEIPPQAHRPRPWGPGDNPMTAVMEFLAETDSFEVDAETNSKLLMTSSRNGYLVRCSDCEQS